MRILHAIRSDGFAGVERHVSRLAIAQAARGDTVHVIGGSVERMAAVFAGTGVGSSRGDTVPQVIAEVRRRVSGADVVHAHMTAAELAVAIATLPRSRVPLVTTRHFPLARGRSRSGRAVSRFIAARIPHQIAISAYVAEHVEGDCTVVYPGVDVQPDGVPAGERPRVVLVVQRLEREKDTSVAVEGFARSGLAEQGWRLQIAGDGALRGELEALAATSGVADHVDFLGARNDVAELMAASAIMVAPCAIEGLGLSVLEAMAAGLPTAACATGGHLETLPVEGHDVCFPPLDADAAGAGLRRLAGDPALRSTLGRLGQQRQRADFTVESQAEGTAAFYAGLLDPRTPS